MQEHGKIYVHYSTLNIHRYRSLCNKEQRQSTGAIKLKKRCQRSEWMRSEIADRNIQQSAFSGQVVQLYRDL